ncbi:MAG: ribosome-associated translation inhibitor RaiA [Acidimicrobiia bacterium]|nr:ribosome-associated translation inhibitor RaiA [Acidimicrobiia bacterium]
MEVHVRGKRTNVDDDLRRLAEEKVARSIRAFEDAGPIDVEFTDEPNPRQTEERCRVEITTKAAGQMVRVEAAGFDHRSALDLAVGKLERQMSRLKERLVERHRRGGDKQLNGTPGGVEETGDTTDLRIERVKRFDVKPMTPQEAALQMELLGHSFYLFLNAQTDRYSVLYRRRGGSLGLIEPQ